MGRFRKSSYTHTERYRGRHRFEHWYRDNSVYFITSKIRDGTTLLSSSAAKNVFWDRYNHYTSMHGFVPWVTTVMNNHYHVLGYMKDAQQLGEMMRKLHGSVAWEVMKLTGIRHVPFWRGRGNRDYFDGCIRDVLQAERAYRYTLLQAVKARIVRDWGHYPHTRVNVEMAPAIRRAVELKAFLEEVPYALREA